MRKIRGGQSDFSYGELSPSTRANTRAEWFASGCQRLLNYIPTPKGSVIRRPGSIFYDFVPAKARLAKYSTRDGVQYVVAIGGTDIRIYDPGNGTVNDFEGDPIILPCTYSENILFELDVIQVSNRLYICHRSVKTHYVTLGDDGFEYVQKEFVTNVYDNSADYVENDVVSFNGWDYICIDAVTAVPPAGDVPSWRRISNTSNILGERRIQRVKGTPSFTEIQQLDVGPWIGNSAYNYIVSGCTLYDGCMWMLKSIPRDRAVPGEPSLSWPECPNVTPDDWGRKPYQSQQTNCGRGGTGCSSKTIYPVSPCEDFLPEFIDNHTWKKVCTFEDSQEPNIVYRWVGQTINAGEYAYTESGVYLCLITTDSKPTDAIPDPTLYWTPIGVSAATLNESPPDSVVWHNNRLFVLGNALNPTQVWGSVVGDIDDFSLGARADAALSFEVTGSEGEPLVCGNGARELIIATSQSELYVTGAAGYVSAEDIVVRRETSVGAAEQGMFESGSAILIIQRAGNKIYQSRYSNETQSYNVRDLTELSDHFFEDTKILQVAVQKTPEPIIWCLLENGTLLSGSHYVNEGRIAWARHETQGEVISVATITAPNSEDQVYWLVKREDLNGEYYSLEYLDRWNGIVSTDMSQNLEWDGSLEGLEDKDVQVYSNGGRERDLVVTEGNANFSGQWPKNIQKDRYKYYCGLGYTSVLTGQIVEPFETRNKASTRVVSCGIKMLNAAGIKVGVINETLDEIAFRSTLDLMGEPVAPFSGEKTVTTNTDLQDQDWLSIIQDGPFRGTILGIFYEMAVGGD